MKFLYEVRDLIPHCRTVGICKLISVEGENGIARRQWNEGFNPFSFSLTFGNPNRATGGGAQESTSNITIDNGEHLSDYIKVRDEFIAIGVRMNMCRDP